ncbi:GTPase-associated system all-helical protein GASH [Microbulbifer sp. PSTR4-B]|uniref:GTPase-associated system all-helical protein GASH n=1 Tax=Microbulbifer sp. PSTR4-B TaxID=3243396 RepID=UPI004039A0C0
MSEETQDIESNEDQEISEIPEMHILFADWMRSSELDVNRDTLDLRWAGVAHLRDEQLDWDEEKELIRVALGMPELKDGPDHWLRKAFKKHDNLFPMTAGTHEFELQTLSTACLAACLEDEDNEERATALSTTILAASFCGQRDFPGNADITEMSTQFALKEGISRRKRKSPSPPNFNFKIRNATKEAVEAVSGNQPAQYEAALKAVLNEFKAHLSWCQDHTKAYVRQSNNQTVIQDEELEILWWLFGEKSSMLNIPVEQVDKLALPAVLGVEFAHRTNLDSELPALPGLLKKAGLRDDQEIAFKDMINKSKPLVENLLEEDEYCPVLSPALHALSITREHSSWQRIWEKDTGLDSKTKASSKDWVTQIYRECLHIRKWG